MKAFYEHEESIVCSYAFLIYFKTDLLLVSSRIRKLYTSPVLQKAIDLMMLDKITHRSITQVSHKTAQIENYFKELEH